MNRPHRFGIVLILWVSALIFSECHADAFAIRPVTTTVPSTAASPRICTHPGRCSTPLGSRLDRTRLQGLPRAIMAKTSPLLSLGAVTGVVLVHECGHYLAARLFGIEVLEFSVGLGPKLFGFQAWGNRFSFRALPLGGYVLFAGEDEEEESGGDPSKWLQNRPWQERAIVYSGGVTFNLILSFALYFGVLVQLGWLKTNSLSNLARYTARFVARMTKDTAVGIGGLFLTLVRRVMPFASKIASTEALTQVSGPVQILKTGSDIASKQGTTSLMWFAGHLSLNLGVVNALPLPVLDGGRLLFVLVEAITGRKVDKRVEENASMVSFLFLLGVVFFASFNDFRFLLART